MKLFLRSLLLGTIITAALAAPTFAFRTQAGDRLRLDEGETTSGTYYAAGSGIEIDGTVNGDLVCAAERLTIRGTVNGDVLCAAKDIVIEGRVEGDVRAAAQTVRVNGAVTRNLHLLAQTVTLEPNGNVGGELMAQASTVTLNGTVGAGAYGSAEQLSLNGPIVGAAQFSATAVTVGQNAKLQGGLEYTSERDATVSQGAQITGEPRRSDPPAGPTPSEQLHTLLVSWIISLLSAALLSLTIVWLFPRLAPRLASNLGRHPGSTSLWGLLLLLAAPIAAILVMITLIGLPLGILALIGWGVAWYLSRVVVAIAVGRLLYPRLFDGDGASHPYRQAVVGVILTWLVFLIPFVGAFASFVATILGAGLIMKAVIDHIDRPEGPKRRRRDAEPAAS